MRLENAVAADVLERILSAYGFTMQKELSDKLGIAKSNVASWMQRGQVPGNVLVQCALDTGADVQWLVNGVFANESINAEPSCLDRSVSRVKGKALIEIMLSTGGRPVLQRIMDAYRFKTQKELSDYLLISAATISTWIRREFFPGDVVIACSLDTGVSLAWLATGKGAKVPRNNSNILIPKKCLNAGTIENSGDWESDVDFIPHEVVKPVFVHSNSGSWIADFGTTDISNGRWILGIDGKYDIYDVVLLPGKKINVTSKGLTFTCGINEVTASGKIVVTMEYNF
ncbi:phage repressor protein CI [Ewingella sp. S1.OA.A_B6]